MTSLIHITKKLEKLFKTLMVEKSDGPNAVVLCKWNATIFYMFGKKCLITNGLTQYNLIVPNFKTKDLVRISDKIKVVFQEQLAYDGINLDLETNLV
jgi:hypothetical protein